MNKETKGTLFAIVAALISGFSIPMNKMFVVSMEPVVFTALRALVIGAIFLVISYKTGPICTGIKKHWKYLVSIAIIGGSIAFLLFFSGLKLTTAGRGAFLQKTLPLYVSVLAFLFLKEKISKKHAVALSLMFIGTCAIYSASINPSEFWSNPSLGDMLIISATVLWAVENIISRKAMLKGNDNFMVSFARMFFGGLILLGVVLLSGNLGVLLSLSSQQLINISISTALLFGYVLFWYWSIRLINVSKACTFLLISPVISMGLGVLMFGEAVPIIQLIGSALILLGAYFVSGVKSETNV